MRGFYNSATLSLSFDELDKFELSSVTFAVFASFCKMTSSGSALGLQSYFMFDICLLTFLLGYLCPFGMVAMILLAASLGLRTGFYLTIYVLSFLSIALPLAFGLLSEGVSRWSTCLEQGMETFSFGGYIVVSTPLICPDS